MATVFVGGFGEEVTEAIVQAAFIPFGIIKEIHMPRDYEAGSSGSHKSFAFVSFEEEEDAQQAIDNMEGAELLGRSIRCNHAKDMPKAAEISHKALWNQESFLEQQQRQYDMELEQEQEQEDGGLVPKAN